MSPILLHLWGPISIHAYGVCTALGVILAFIGSLHDAKLKKLISSDNFITAVQVAIISGCVGAKVVFLLSESYRLQDYSLILRFWEPGGAILGSIIGILVSLYFYLHAKKISFLAFMDRFSIYAPIAQSFGRVGCFLTGCCYGAPSQGWWTVTYTDINHAAPLYVSLHPSQLYSAIALFGIFLFLYFVVQYCTRTPGIIFYSYMLLVSLERFFIDFVRSDRVFSDNAYFAALSIHQWIALGLCIGAIICIILLKQSKKTYGSV